MTGVLRKALHVLTGVVAGAGLTLVGIAPAVAAESPLPVLAQISTSDTHTCAVTIAGAAYCWGRDDTGQLGNGPAVTANQSSPSPVTTPPGVVWAQISAGWDTTCALTTSGAAYCWGVGFLGSDQVGSADEPTPVTTPAGVTFRSVSNGTSGTCALTTTDALYCWGYAGVNSTSGPTLAPGGPWANVSLGNNIACAVDTAGTGYCWGAEVDGELGNGGSTTDWVEQPTPVAAPPGVHWSSITAREQVTCGVTTTGAAYCWGTNYAGALGNPFSTGGSSATPSLVTAPDGVTDVTWTDVQPATYGACGLASTGAIHCWGVTYYDDEPEIPAGSLVTSMTASSSMSCILSDGGRAWCLGDDRFGQIGDGGDIHTGDYSDSYSPVGFPQTITFPDLPQRIVLTAGSFTIGQATASSGRPVTLSGSDACSMSGSTVTLLRTGNCVIRASVAGGDGWAPTEADASVRVDGDGDGDGVADRVDNCPTTANPGQVNTDGDTQGNACDADDDNDGVLDVDDAFPLDATESVDTDHDGVGNDADTDDDGDGVPDVADAFPLDPDEHADTDHDGVGNNADTDDDGDGHVDAADAFPLDADEWIDTDGDGTGNNADTDDDGDGIPDDEDALPLDPAEHLDTDHDGIGNTTDTDDDGDGHVDAADAFPLDADEWADTDGDGVGNNADTDDDNDGVADSVDAFPLNPDEHADTDHDGVGNNADSDDDGDGHADAADAFPLDAGEWVDTDGDGVGNNADTDDDNDGVADSADAFPLNPDEHADVDGDGIGDNADTDDDNDGIPDISDPFPTNPDETVDTDGDGVGDHADTDDDGDGIPDRQDAFPLTKDGPLSGTISRQIAANPALATLLTPVHDTLHALGL